MVDRESLAQMPCVNQSNSRTTQSNKRPTFSWSRDISDGTPADEQCGMESKQGGAIYTDDHFATFRG